MRTTIGWMTLAAVLLGCGDESATTPGGGADGQVPAMGVVATGEVVARVGPGGVLETEFIERALRTPGGSSNQLGPDARMEVLGGLVVEEALWQEAMAKELYRDPKVRKIMVNLLLRQEVYAKVSASDFGPEQIQAYFEEHRDEFIVPEKIQVKRIFLRVGRDRTLEQANALATDLRNQLLAQPDRFKELAAEYSEGQYKRRGGDLGYLSREGKPGVPVDVVNRAFELEVGDVSEPFEAADGVNIVAVVSRRDKVERTFEQMKGSVLRKLKNQRFRELESTYTDSIQDKYPVSIDEQKLNGIDLAAAREGGMVTGDDEPAILPDEPGTPEAPAGVPGGDEQEGAE